MTKREVLENAVRGLRLPSEVTRWLFKTLARTKTPEEFENKIIKLSDKLRRLTFFSDNYRSNWHGWECECDECLKDEYPEECK